MQEANKKVTYCKKPFDKLFYFFLTEGQNNFSNKIPLKLEAEDWNFAKLLRSHLATS